jgi:hypothetical protein
MSDIEHIVGLCCYRYRALVMDRCEHCKLEYACPQFVTKEAVVEFNAIIPPSMLLSPLPIELWPKMCAHAKPGNSPPSSSCATGDSAESPLQRLISTLGLPIDLDTRSR